MKTATLIRSSNRDHPQGGTQHFAVYRVAPPHEGHDFVYVSARDLPGYIRETYLFGCDGHGTVINWGELTGSTRGTLDHAEALRNAGYEIAP